MTNTEAWDYAIGMIKVDGLEPTKESQKWAKKMTLKNIGYPKIDKEGYPGLVFYHSHDRYQKKKLKLRNKITKVSNNELMKAICV